MKFFLPLLLLLTITLSTGAQQTVYDIMERNDISIREAESMANSIFNITGTGRGTGYKQFQRWLYERKFHTDENGYFISPQTEWKNYQQSLGLLSPIGTEAANWTELGPTTWNRTSSWNPGTGRLTAIAIHPSNESVIYVGSPGGGLWKTINAGANWQPLTDNNSTWMSIFALTIDPVNQNIVYAGTSGSAGLLKSTNAGSSWAPTGGGPSGTIRKILIHPSATNIVFAAATNGIWRSVNAGTSWTQVHTGSKEDIEFKPDNLNIMYASGSDVYRSIDNGITWTLVGVAEGITNTGRTLVAVSPANPNYVYAVQASGSLFGRMYKSTDAGLTFTTTVVGNPASGTNYFGYETTGTGTGGQATYDMAMDVSPTNASEVYIAGIICWKSVNEGTSFTAITAWSLPNSIGYNHADVHGLFWINSTIYSLSDGGAFKSTDAGDNWTDISSGLGIRQFYRIANSQTNANVITGGAQDNGSAARQASGNWVDWLGADGMEGLVSPTDHLKLWGTSQNGALYRSVNGGNSYNGLGQPSSGQWVTPLSIHPTNETILYGGWTGVYKSINSGTSWTNISGTTITTTLADLAVAPSDPNFIYASNGAALYVTTDDGATWAVRSAPSTINDIAVDPTNPSKIWIACNSSSNRILVSTDAGATFTNISSNLPAIVARTIVVDDNTPRGMYIGMNIGVYYKTEADVNWANYSDNLPLVAINELEIQKAAGKIRVATYGRGVWESPVADAVPTGFTFSSPVPVVSACPTAATMQTTLTATYNGSFSTPISLTSSVSPAGPIVSFGTNPLTTSGTSTTVIITNASTLSAGSYVVTVAGTAGTTLQTRNITFTINPGAGPVITTQPVSQAICTGGNVTFTVAATSTYQWQMSTAAVPAFTNIGGATTASYTIAGVTAGLNSNQYRCVVSSQCGSTNSNAAVLTVNTAPAITAQPQSVTLCAGSNNTFNVVASGTVITYQWQVSTIAVPAFTDIPAATSASYSVTGITAGMNGNQYRCVVSGSCTPAATSNAATLTVVTSVGVTTQPISTIVCDGGTTSFTVAGSGTGIIYQWQVNTGSGFINVPASAPYSGTTSATLNITGATTAMNAYQYRCQLSNATCTIPGVSNTATLTINTLPAISANPQSATICSGGGNSFSVTASGTGITYQWQISTTAVPAFTNITGANAATYIISSAAAGMNGNQYRCVVSGTCSASTATSNVATLSVITPVTVATQPTAVELCSGANATFTVAGMSTQTINYQWELSTNGGATWSPITGANAAAYTVNAITVAMSNNRYRCQLSNATCTVPTTSNPVMLMIRQLPTVGLTASKISLSPGQSSTLTATPTASTGGILITTWTYNGNPLAVTGNSYVANVEKTGAYQARIAETWPGGLLCSNLSPVITIDAPASNKLFIFPSPNDGAFTVSYYNNGGISASRTVTIYDSRGAKVEFKQFTVTGPYSLLSIDIKPAQKGVYYVVVGDANGKALANGKVVVQ